MFPVLHEHRNHRFSDCDDHNCETSKDHADESKDGTFNMPTIAFPYHRCQRFDHWLNDKDNPIAPDMFIPNSIYRRRFKEKYLPVLEEGKQWAPLRLATGEEEMILFEQENKDDESIYVDESGNQQIKAASNDNGPILVTVEINGIPATAPTPTLLLRPISTHSKDQHVHASTGTVSDAARNRVIGARILKKNGSIDNGSTKKGKQNGKKEVIGFDSHTVVPTKRESAKPKGKSAASASSSKKTFDKETDDQSVKRKESISSTTGIEIAEAMQRYLRATSQSGSNKNDELQSVNDSVFSELANLATQESVKEDEEPTESIVDGRNWKHRESARRSGISSVFSEGSEFDYVKEFQKLVRENTLERMAAERKSMPQLGASSWSKSYLKAAQNNKNLKSANERQKQQEEQLRQAENAKKPPKGKTTSNLGFFQRRMPSRTNELLRNNKGPLFSNSMNQKSNLNLPSLVEKDPKNSKVNSSNSSNVGGLETEPSYDASFVADSGIGSSQVSLSQHDDKMSEHSSEIGIHLHSKFELYNNVVTYRTVDIVGRRKTKLPKLPIIVDKEELETNGKGNLEEWMKGENLGANEFGKIVESRRRKESFIVSEASFFHNGASACMVSSHCFKESGIDASINSKRRWHSFSSITEQLLYFYKTIDERRNSVERNQIIC